MDARKALEDIGLSVAEAEKNPGRVVKCFRERQVYEDQQTGKRKHWTQDDLARMVGLTKVQICNMENHNEGLDSIERRKTLATILKIPPVLLGLASLDEIVEVVTGQEQNTGKAKRTKANVLDVKKYQDMFKVYDTLFAEGATYGNVAAIEHTIARIRDDLDCTNSENRNALLRVLWGFEILCAKVYGSDFLHWTKTFEHLENALEIATLLNGRDLQAASLYTSSEYHLRQGRLGLARVDVDGALMYAKGALPQTKGLIYSEDAFLHTKILSSSNVVIAQKMLDEAQKYAGAKSEIKTIKFGKGTYFLYKAETFLDMGRPAKALSYIEDAVRYITPSKRRLFIYLDILQAKCYIAMKKPEYEQAMCLLESAITDSEKVYVERNIRFIEKLYGAIQGSSYGNSPDAVDLGLQIQKLRLRDLAQQTQRAKMACML